MPLGAAGSLIRGSRRDRAIHAPISRLQSHPSTRSAWSAFRKSREGGRARATSEGKLIRREGRETCNERRKRKRGRAYRRKYKGTGGSMSVIDRDGAEKTDGTDGADERRGMQINDDDDGGEQSSRNQVSEKE